MSLKQRFNDLDSRQKKVVVWSGIGIVFLLIVITGYNSSSDKTGGVTFFGRKESREIQLEPDLIQKTMLREQRRQLDDLQQTVQAIQKEQKKYNQSEDHRSSLPEIPSADKVAGKVKTTPLPPTDQPWPMPITNGVRTSSPPPPKREPQIIDEITVLSNPDVTMAGIEGTGANGKKKVRTVYLPPSFMEAKLLTGFDASTSGQGTNNPEPLLLRIQTPAVLPNDIKANLRGCFVIAEAVGRLDKERADVRLVSLSCLSNEGRAVIDTPIKGFVTDADSKVGLSGRVVSRMGAAIARTIVAGFFGGLGDMLKSTATTQSTSALGTTTTVDSGQIANYSIGGGLSKGASSLHNFYLSLAKQTTPVIEVAANKKITVIISEGKELEIKEIKQDETL